MHKMIAAIIVAAGKSSRMGPPKQLLPWRGATVIESVVSTLEAGAISPLICVLGREGELIAQKLAGTSVQSLQNPNYQNTEMVESFQMGLAHLAQTDNAEQISGTLLSLGDQPHISPDTIARIVKQINHTPRRIVIPSHNMRRGHPFYLPQPLWRDVLGLRETGTLRQLLKQHEQLITYVESPTDDILWDMDTPEEYEMLRQRWAKTY